MNFLMRIYDTLRDSKYTITVGDEVLAKFNNGDVYKFTVTDLGQLDEPFKVVTTTQYGREVMVNRLRMYD